MKLRFEKRVLDLLEGSIDIHIHAAPDIYPRIVNVMELARHGKEMGMRALLVKNHFVMTRGQAAIVSDEVDFPVFGGIALNLPLGGLNIHAVDIALKLGGKQVWLPTLHSRTFVQHKSHLAHLAGGIRDDIEGIYLLNDEGNLREELLPIFDLIAENDAILGTGHVSMEEAKVAGQEATKRGVKRILLTHPLASFCNYGVEDMKEMLNLVATYLEHTYNDVTRQVSHPFTLKDLYTGIKAIGPKHFIVSTDAGQ
jgi:hypothetical protein